MKITRSQKIISAIVFAILLFVSVPTSFASATTTTTGSGYGGECTIPVTPPSGGFGLTASPIYRDWWDWWTSPKIWLSINGGNAYEMKISNRSDFSDSYKTSYTTGMKWRVYRPEHEGWKTVYVKFLSSCGKESPTVSRTYYYWGW